MWPRVTTGAIAIVFLTMTLGLTHCANKKVNPREGQNLMPAKPIGEVLKLHTKEMMSIPGVVGMAQGLCNDKPCIRIYVVRKTPDLERKIPRTLDGYLVMIEETGRFHALPKDEGSH
jgi:hypothetical protein